MADIKAGEVTIGAGEELRIQEALAALRKDPHAPREINVRYTLHVHNEYPKHVVTGKDKEGNPVTRLVNNPKEEKALKSEAE